jgi:hypothetical protein
MRNLGIKSIAMVTLLAAGLLCLGSPKPQTPNVETLKAEIQGKKPDEVRALIIRRFGPPAREVGSGFQIEQWDVDGGVLTFHPLTGPTFSKGGVQTRLIRTTNRAELCLFGSYEMTTLPEGPNGMEYWLGDVSLATDSRYRFTDSGNNLDHRDGQRDNFFMLHPHGSAQVNYASGVSPKTRLEDLPDGSLVATVRFTAPDRRSSAVYRIVAYRTSMSLVFEGEALPFRMEKEWVNYWR